MNITSELPLKGVGDFIEQAPKTWDDEHRTLWAELQAAQHNKTTYRIAWEKAQDALQRRAEPGAEVPRDYAMEHAGYLAKAVEDYIKVMGEESPHPDDRSDAWRAMRGCVYEFRKRERTPSPPTANQTTEPMAHAASDVQLKFHAIGDRPLVEVVSRGEQAAPERAKCVCSFAAFPKVPTICGQHFKDRETFPDSCGNVVGRHYCAHSRACHEGQGNGWLEVDHARSLGVCRYCRKQPDEVDSSFQYGAADFCHFSCQKAAIASAKQEPHQ